MPVVKLTSSELRFTIDPDTLNFSDTSELLHHPLPWIGQERAKMAAHFGLGMNQPGYNLFVLGEVGSGRSSLLRQAIIAAATNREIPPDLCYLNNFDAPEKPQALRLPAGKGRLFRKSLAQRIKSLQKQIPLLLQRDDFREKGAWIRKQFKKKEAEFYAEIGVFAEGRNFSIHREDGRLVFTLRGEKGHVLTEDELLALSKEQRADIEQAEDELRVELTHYMEKLQPLEREMETALVNLQHEIIKPLLKYSVEEICPGLDSQSDDYAKLDVYLEQMSQDILENLSLFKTSSSNEENKRQLDQVTACYQVNLVVDNGGLKGAPAIIDENPLFRSLFGSIEYQSKNEVLVTDFTGIRAGNLLKANGGFLMLHLHDLMANELIWEKLCRFLRSGKLKLEEPGSMMTPITVISLEPEMVDVDVKIILIGSREQYYALQEDPEFARRFRVKVDFVESFPASSETRRASSVFIAHACLNLGLPHFSAAAVARLLEESHREVDDQSRQSAIFSHTEALIMESAEFCRARTDGLVERSDVEAALAAHDFRHDYPEQSLQESIIQEDILISVSGEKTGQINGLTQIDLIDYRFGFPVRITARTFAGEDGLLNIEREVEMSGPLHDKGVFILQNYLSALFTQNVPLNFNASIVFEQEYHGIEGDSASCAELFALLSSLSGLPLKQGIAVTGAINQHGDMLPVGGINEKIEGYFRVCEAAGLDGSQGVLIPYSNQRHLMLNQKIIDAVTKGLFHIYTAKHANEGIALLSGFQAGVADKDGNYSPDSLLGHAQKTLLNYYHASQTQPQHKNLR